MKRRAGWRTLAAVLVAGLLIPLAGGGCLAGTVHLDGKLNCPYISDRGGTAFLHISLSTHGLRPVGRRPMNVSVVLDRSGSMGDQRKMEHALASLHALVDRMHREDILSIVIYDDVVEVLRPAARLHNRDEVRRLLERVYPRGATNLGGGLVEGFRQVERNAGREYTNRVILLSDGLANRGITDASSLGRIARKHRSRSISLTTIGMGLDYNENLMVSLSESGGGNYYFVESSHGLAGMLHREFDGLSDVVAQNGMLELSLGRGVVVKDVVGYECRSEGGKYRIPIGDVYANERREFTVEVWIPPARDGERSIRVAEGRLFFDPANVSIGSPGSFSVKVRYTRDLAEVERNRDLKVQAQVDIAVSTRKVEHALKALDDGRKDEALQELEKAAQIMAASPAAKGEGAEASAVREQAENLRSYSDTVKDSDDADGARRAKKSIQYDNYRVQKGKK